MTIHTKEKIIYILASLLFLCNSLGAQILDKGEYYKKDRLLPKITGAEDRKQGLHSGNLARTLFYNYGTIGYPYTHPSGEWPNESGHFYLFEFGIICGAEVVDVHGDTIHIMSEGIVGGIANEGGDVSPDGIVWGWQPLPGYAAPGQDWIAMSDQPSSWPDHWPNRTHDWDGFWIGEYGRGNIRANQESYYVMDDRDNAEFAFYPDSTDSTRRGLGFEVEVRGYQWAHHQAEDCIFWIYEITNKSTTDYEKVVFGMYGDADVGGPEDWNDDDSWFDVSQDIVYQWDHDNRGVWGGEVGYFGYKYLESPGNPHDGIDNDGDGMTDERRDDGIDNDGDWRRERDDVGADGIADTNDDGEGDGVPTAGEPNFDDKDIDESDQIGLTAFSAFVWPSVRVSDDEELWRRSVPGNFPQPEQNADIVFLYSSGYFPLKAGETQRFSIALLFGENKQDIIRNGEVVQKIYNNNYTFTKAPDKPKLTAVPGDKKVTLYWDQDAEFSVDPVVGEDFEGYKVYRATDPGFNEIRNITDGYGVDLFLEPIAQFDLKNGITGFHELHDNTGVHFYLGDDTGLEHSWTDTTVYNGMTYFYAVVSYDRGDSSLLISPTECTKVINKDAAGNIVTDVNTAVVVPNALPPGFQSASIDGKVAHIQGYGTGEILVDILDPTQIKQDGEYKIVFDDTTVGTLTYSFWDITAGKEQNLFKFSQLLQGEDGNAVFDGMRIRMKNDTLDFDQDLSGWISGDCNYLFTGDVYKNGYKDSSNYEICFSDTTVEYDAVFNIPAPFEIWDIIQGKKIRFVLIDQDNSGAWSSGDDIIFLKGETGVNSTWQVTLTAPGETPIDPGEGDVFQFSTKKPFTGLDVFSFFTSAASIDQQIAKSGLEKIAVVPNPYVSTAVWEPAHNYTMGRGERKIYFVNLPTKATIRIYTTRGFHVKTIIHESAINNGAETWDLLSKDGVGIAFGVYIYHVEAPGIGEKIGKFALIK